MCLRIGHRSVAHAYMFDEERPRAWEHFWLQMPRSCDRLGDARSPWYVERQLFMRKPDATESTGIRGYWVIELTSVMAKWYAFDAGEDTGTAGMVSSACGW